MTCINRYLQIVGWARRRYCEDCVLVLSHGGEPTTYSRIERAAFTRYVQTGD